ncbi:MAG: GldG family protein [Myxococcaceae bacterium]|nr:GldG family protein [Myxococcaceae bacterium]
MGVTGRLAGGIAIVLLLSSPFTAFVSSWVFGTAQAGIAVALIALYFATNWAHFGQFASRRSTSYFLISMATGLALLGALAAVNVIAYRKNVRWDLSKNHIFTLAKQTKDALQKMPEPVRVVTFIPSNAGGLRDRVEPLLNRYQREAPEKFAYEFKDPARTPDLVREYRLQPGQPAAVLLRGEGDRQQRLLVPIYDGLTEQDLTNALLELGGGAKRNVYFIEGHGEWPLTPKEGGAQAERMLSMYKLEQALSSEGYNALPLNLASKGDVPDDAAGVILSGARSPLAEMEVAALERFLARGGRMIIGAEPEVDEGLSRLLEKYAVQLDDGMLADSQYMHESIYFLVVAPEFFSDHPIVRPLKGEKLNLAFPTARGLSILREGMLPGVTTLPLLTTSPNAWEETTPNETPQPSSGEKAGQIVLAAAATRPVPQQGGAPARETRLVVIGDSETLTDAMLTFEGNLNFVLNCLAWITDQPNRITIRPPDRDLSTIDMTPDTVAQIRFFSVALLPITLLCVAVGVWIQRRNK